MKAVMESILRTEDILEYGLFCRPVYGLNIFVANHIDNITLNDPRFVFLQSLTNQYSCSIHAGSTALNDLVNNPADFFASALPDNIYLPTSVDLYNSTFGDMTGWPSPPSCFFPTVGSNFWKAHEPNGPHTLEYLLRCAALAVYVKPLPGGLEEMTRLVSGRFPGNEEWIRESAKHYTLVVITGHDGEYFDIYASSVKNFDMLATPMATAANSIESSSWYQNQKHSLRWDEEDYCLKPKLDTD